MTIDEREKLLAWLDEQIEECEKAIAAHFADLDNVSASHIVKNLDYKKAYLAVKTYLENQPVSDELTQLRTIVAECVSLTDLMRYGLTIDEARAVFARCETEESE